MSWREQVAFDVNGHPITVGCLVKPVPGEGKQFPKNRNPLVQKWPVVGIRHGDDEDKTKVLVVADLVLAEMKRLYGDQGNALWFDASVNSEIEVSPVEPRVLVVCNQNEDPWGQKELKALVNTSCDDAFKLLRAHGGADRLNRNKLISNLYSGLREMLAVLDSTRLAARHKADPAQALVEYEKLNEEEIW